MLPFKPSFLDPLNHIGYKIESDNTFKGEVNSEAEETNETGTK
jgi:hypothetical protein